MKTIELPETSPELASLLAPASDEDLVVKLPDGREFIVVAIDDFDDEIARTRESQDHGTARRPSEIYRNTVRGRSQA